MVAKKLRFESVVVSICLISLFMVGMVFQIEETDKETDKKIKIVKGEIIKKGYSFKVGRTCEFILSSLYRRHIRRLQFRKRESRCHAGGLE